jgi:predicted nucleic acid-binding protein
LIVIDASAMTQALVGRVTAPELLAALAGDIAAPHLLDVEVLSALRGLTLGGKLAPEAADAARADHFAFTITRYEMRLFAERVWELRHQFGSYDACYLALAEGLDVPLYTCDSKLDSDAHGAEVRVF